MKGDIKIVTAVAPVNIALIKYWGKENEDLIIPLNDSISITLDMDQMRARTTVACSSVFKKDRLWLNGREEPLNERISRCLEQIRGRKREEDVSAPELNYYVHICSENNFPTAAGLASSAAGYAALVKSLSYLYELDGELSSIARRGSGSACRSIYGGFVQWNKGSCTDGSDSSASQLAPHSYWPEIRVLILVVSGDRKPVGSTEGMRRSVDTSSLLHYRAKTIVPERCESMQKAIAERNFEAVAELCMRDSDQLHAICKDTYPSITYMNDTSNDICKLVHALNSFLGGIKVAYTFDAGPNACLLVEENNLRVVASTVRHFFPSNDQQFVTGLDIPGINQSPPQEFLQNSPFNPRPGKIKNIISTRIGQGADILKHPDDNLLDSFGMPK